MKSKIFVEFYKVVRNQFIAMNDGMEFITSKPVIGKVREISQRVILRNERGLFSRVAAFRVLKDGKPVTPILTV